MIEGAIAISRCRDIARWAQWVCFLWGNCADFARFDPFWVSMGCALAGWDAYKGANVRKYLTAQELLLVNRERDGVE
ncbi:MAG TPA: hypothetical protein PKZ01_11135 [Candidatus Hydrogenedentes bacterium]|nr:hypothetical protein [Candidatus Hydrogenedentota bacterium]